MSETSFIKTPKQLIWVVALALIVPIVVIILLVNFVASSRAPSAGSNAFTPEAVTQRIAPLASTEFNASGMTAAPAPVIAAAPPAAASPAAPTGTSVAAIDGKVFYDKACMACHAAGVLNAPKLGDKAAWAPRLGLGVDGLTASAIKGKNAMPPRGGAAGASDAEIKAAVQYMVNAVK